MAIAARDVPITRDDVAAWIKKWEKSKKKDKGTLEDYVRAQVAKLKLPDDEVDTTYHDSLPDSTHVADMIIDDLSSYGY